MQWKGQELLKLKAFLQEQTFLKLFQGLCQSPGWFRVLMYNLGPLCCS